MVYKYIFVYFYFDKEFFDKVLVKNPSDRVADGVLQAARLDESLSVQRLVV
jgi:hypothetical protein